MSESDDQERGTFRDTIATIDDSGKRAWIYPKKPSGKLYQYRTYVSVVLLALLFIGPFLKANGDPLFLFNILERKFIIFGFTFWPQDFYLFVLAMITFIVFIVLFTVIFGRVFCGWACPQTVFMEMVFRKIEYFVEGDANQQKRLNAMPWNGEKIRKKGLKLSIFFVISVLIGNTLLAYLVGIDSLKDMILNGPAASPGLFAGMIVFSGIFFFVFSYFREQACIVVCPYGRLQGVLLTAESMVVAYDYHRGEPRGKMKKGEERSLGDCIDCKLCVQVCPTGIDIRHGTQLECVNCTACIDACNGVMDKINKPHGLIRVTSEKMIAEKEKFKLTPRIAAYAAVLTILVLILGFSLTSARGDVEATILRSSGMLSQKMDDTHYRNIYNVQITNKTIDSLPIRLVVREPLEGVIEMIGGELSVGGRGIAKGVFSLVLPEYKLEGHKTPVVIEVYSGDKLLDETETNFLGPIR